jgi:protein tyrosine phosphatase (PTP) superfamily phosphohydrolase (DUF442 family)
MMKTPNPFKTILDFVKLTISRYTPINFMGNHLESIFNFLQLSPTIATAGQPTEDQLSLISTAGYQVVINLAPLTATNALANESAIVEALGMEYIHIPVQFDHPTAADFAQFCTTMQEQGGQSIFVHCAANMRVSAFMYLYQRIYAGWSDETAKTELQKIWIPNDTWQQFMQQILEQHGIQA